MPGSGHHLRAVFGRADFRRLFGTRLTSQFADGIFQAGLAGTILFNPDRHTSALAIAIGFAVLLLPYSFVGPFAGVLLDKWSRRDVLLYANLARAVLAPAIGVMIWYGVDTGAFLPITLVAIGVQRFFHAGLSAALPHVTDDEQLVTANSLSNTLGGIAYTAGIAAAMGLRPLLGASDHGYAVIAACALFGYLLSARVAAKFASRALGPGWMSQHRRLGIREAVRQVSADIADGGKHLIERPNAGFTLLAISGARICYGVAMLGILLLYRNYFESTGFFRDGEVGMGQVMVAAAIGAMLAAAITPAMSRHFTSRRWLALLLGLCAVTDAALISFYTMPAVLGAAFFTAVASQGGKILCETALQHECDDDYRGRVFSVFDTVFNACMVLGMLIGALTLPSTGKSYAVLAGVCVAYGLLSVGYLFATRRTAQPHMASVQPNRQVPLPEVVR